MLNWIVRYLKRRHLGINWSGAREKLIKIGFAIRREKSLKIEKIQ